MLESPMSIYVGGEYGLLIFNSFSLKIKLMSRAENCDGHCPFETQMKKKKSQLILGRGYLESASDSALMDPNLMIVFLRKGLKL